MAEILLNKETFEGLNSRFNTAFSQAEEAAECAHKAENAQAVSFMFDLNKKQVVTGAENIRSVMSNVVSAFSETDNELANKNREIGEQYVGPAFNDAVAEFIKANKDEIYNAKEAIKAADELIKEGFYFDPNDKEFINLAWEAFKMDPGASLSLSWEMMKNMKPSQIKALYSPDIKSAKDAEKIGKAAKEIVGGKWGKVVGASAQLIVENIDNKGFFPTSFLDNLVKDSFNGFKEDIKKGDIIGSTKNAVTLVTAAWFDYGDMYTAKWKRYMTGIGLDFASDKVGKVGKGLQALSKYIPEDWHQKDVKNFLKTTTNVIQNVLTGTSCVMKYYM